MLLSEVVNRPLKRPGLPRILFVVTRGSCATHELAFRRYAKRRFPPFVIRRESRAFLPAQCQEQQLSGQGYRGLAPDLLVG